MATNHFFTVLQIIERDLRQRFAQWHSLFSHSGSVLSLPESQIVLLRCETHQSELSKRLLLLA